MNIFNATTILKFLISQKGYLHKNLLDLVLKLIIYPMIIEMKTVCSFGWKLWRLNFEKIGMILKSVENKITLRFLQVFTSYYTNADETVSSDEFGKKYKIAWKNNKHTRK